MAFIPAPDFRIRASNWTLERPAQINVSGWTGRRTVVADPWHGKWRAEVELAALSEEHARAMRSFFARAKGSINTFRLQASVGKQNNNFGVTVASTAAAGATSMTISGAATPMLDGQYATVNGQLLLLTANQSGSTLNFQPPLRAQATAGTRVVTSQPYALVHLREATAGWSVDIDRVYGISFSVEEAILETDGTAPEEFADIGSLDLNFAAGSYTAGGASYALTLLPGYSFTRSGTQGARDASGSVQWFAANVIARNSAGYHAYEAVTNLLLNSQSFDSWTGGGAVTANSAVAPDGTTTADTLAVSSSTISQGLSGLTGGATYTCLVFAKRAPSGSANAIRYTTNNGGAWNTGISTKLVLTNDWQPLIGIGAVSDSSFATVMIGSADASGNHDADCTGNVLIWQAQLVAGNFPDGGPLIATTGSTASVGASALSVTMTSGSYSATYTFDDNSTQAASPTVSGNTFNHPTKATLNRGIIKRTQVSA